MKEVSQGDARFSLRYESEITRAIGIDDPVVHAEKRKCADQVVLQALQNQLGTQQEFKLGDLVNPFDGSPIRNIRYGIDLVVEQYRNGDESQDRICI